MEEIIELFKRYFPECKAEINDDGGVAILNIVGETVLISETVEPERFCIASAPMSYQKLRARYEQNPMQFHDFGGSWLYHEIFNGELVDTRHLFFNHDYSPPEVKEVLKNAKREA